MNHAAAEILAYFDRVAIQKTPQEAVQHTVQRFGVTVQDLQRWLIARSVAERLR